MYPVVIATTGRAGTQVEAEARRNDGCGQGVGKSEKASRMYEIELNLCVITISQVNLPYAIIRFNSPTACEGRSKWDGKEGRE